MYKWRRKRALCGVKVTFGTPATVLILNFHEVNLKVPCWFSQFKWKWEVLAMRDLFLQQYLCLNTFVFMCLTSLERQRLVVSFMFGAANSITLTYLIVNSGMIFFKNPVY